MQITFSAAALPKTGAIVIPVFEDGAKPKAYGDIDKATEGAIERAVKAADFKPKKGKLLDIVAPAGLANGPDWRWPVEKLHRAGCRSLGWQCGR